MNRKNYLKMEFPSYAGNEGFAKTAVTSFVSRLDSTVEEMREIRTAVSEAVSNCIIHAYPKEIGVITLCCRILEDNVISIMIKDCGVGFREMPEEHGGMGFRRMKSLMTELRVVSVPGKGTMVHMKRKLKRYKGDEHEQSETEKAELCDS
jgi:stage II sporulation protein AB (anti-sigma F factor)